MTFRAMRGDARATALKLADRISNVWVGTLENSHKKQMYHNEQEQFGALLYVPDDGNGPKWDVLEGLLQFEPYCGKYGEDAPHAS